MYLNIIFPSPHRIIYTDYDWLEILTTEDCICVYACVWISLAKKPVYI